MITVHIHGQRIKHLFTCWGRQFCKSHHGKQVASKGSDQNTARSASTQVPSWVETWFQCVLWVLFHPRYPGQGPCHLGVSFSDGYADTSIVTWQPNIICAMQR